MLTAKQRELLLFIDSRLKQDGVSPSFDEMREALDLKSKSGVHRLISALEERGFIRRLPNRARALEVVKLPETQPSATVTPIRHVAPAPANDTLEIPLHGDGLSASSRRASDAEGARPVRLHDQPPYDGARAARHILPGVQARRSPDGHHGGHQRALLLRQALGGLQEKIGPNGPQPPWARDARRLVPLGRGSGSRPVLRHHQACALSFFS